MLTSRRAPGRSIVLGLIAALAVSVLPGAPIQPARAVSPDIVVSEVYGGGGNAGATYTHDYIELFNRGSSTVNLTGWSVQYASATGTGNFAATPLRGSLAAGQYYLVQEAAGVGGTTPLPAPNATGSIAMSATAGKVIVANVATALACNGGSTPCSPTQLAQIVDLVGYGAANFFETAAAPTLSNTTAAIRAGNGATDTDNNSIDFVAGAPDPDSSIPEVAPSVASTVPVNGAVDVPPGSNVTITFNEPVSAPSAAFSIACPPGSGALGFSLSGGPVTFTLDPILDLPPNTFCGVTIAASRVTDLDTDDPPDNMLSSASFGFTTGAASDPCEDPFTPIYDIQGSGLAAAITGSVTTEGVVVGDFEGTAGLQGFYLQDATGDADVTTSDGIFIFTGSGNAVAEGDLVRVTGFARERFNQTAINGSNSNTAFVTDIISCGNGESVDPVDVTLPVESATWLERLEGMLVRFPQALVISEYFNYERFGELVLAQPLAGETRPFTPTSIVEPGDPAIARALANTLSRITLDDGLGIQNPPSVRHPNGAPFSLLNRFRGGDTVANATGVLGFDFSLYRIHPTAPADYTAINLRPAASDPVGGTIRAAALNTLNFFLTPDYPNTTPSNPLDNTCGGNANLECRGADADQPDEFSRQRDKLLAALAALDADIIGLNEIENTPGVEPLGDPAKGIVAGLNDILGPGTYEYVDTGVIGTDAIRVGLIYKPANVQPVGDFEILDSTVDPRFIDTLSRPVLAQTFEEVATEARITVAVNHLKSKGSACPGDADAGDGQGNCNGTRELAAQALVDWLQTDPTGSGDRDYLILGDLNSYAQEDPIDAIRAGADDVAGTADDYTNLIAQYQGTYAYSFVFDGQAGYLDHALASPTLAAQVTGATEWHINADEPDFLDYDTSFKPPEQDAVYEPNAYRSSDHDPVIVGLNLFNFEFSGFLPPVDNPPVLNSVNAGRTIPMKFTLSGDLGLDVLFGVPMTTELTCDASVPIDEVATTTAGDEGLIFDPATGLYTYAWKTERAWAGQCRTFAVTFDDGAYRTADFRFR